MTVEKGFFFIIKCPFENKECMQFEFFPRVVSGSGSGGGGGVGVLNMLGNCFRYRK